MKTALILGASKGIGLAFVNKLLNDSDYSKVIASHRDSKHLLKLKELFPEKLSLVKIDAADEESFNNLDKALNLLDRLDFCINCIGILNDQNTKPERQISEVNPTSLEWAFKINTVPTLILAKKVKNLFRKSSKPIFAALSAKVGSVSDNKMGGWHSYRISKAALNMAIKNIALEFSRINRDGTVIALHPGTTITDLSKPFLDGASKKYKLHQPEETVNNLINVLSNLNPKNDNGKLFSWDNLEIQP